MTGAADDDPSGIATYSIAGAQFGTAFLWTAPFTWPLMAAVQSMCARIGMVTGQGIMSALRLKFPRPLLAVVCAALFLANTLNIGANLAAMADAAELLTGITSRLWILLFAGGITWATVQLRYAHVARVLKWLTLALLAYVVAAFQMDPDWHSVWLAVRAPSVPDGTPIGASGWATLVAILGTTISPYLFFWQASQEVEEEKGTGRITRPSRLGATVSELRWRKIDVGIGTFMSNAVMFFIMLTTALTLHTQGITELTTSREVAEALRPLAGEFATLLYTVGLIGTGALAIPTLAGSAAYASAELFNWRQGMDETFHRAPAFYAAIMLSLVLGVSMEYADVNVLQALYWTAVLNGLLAPFLLVGIVMVASDRIIMHGQPSSLLGRAVVWLTTLLMIAAAFGMAVV